MVKKLSFLILCSIVFFPNIGKSLESQWKGIDEVQLRIISPLTNSGENEEMTLGIEYKLKDGWKTYWKSPGAGGFPQTIDYSSSVNVDNLKILWPSPIPFSILGMRSLGYEDNVVFPINIEIVDITESIYLNLNIHFLICKDVCIPVDVHLELFLPNNEKTNFTEHIFIIEKYISLSPLDEVENYNFNINKITMHTDNENHILEIEIKQNYPFKKPQIYIDNDLGLPVVEPEIEFNENRKLLNAKFFYYDTFIDLDKNNLNIHISDFPFVYEQKVEFEISSNDKKLFFDYKLINIIFIALLGGLILNVMPCVLPVLSLKLLSVEKYSGKDKFFIRQGFFATVLGILISYALLALLLLLLKYSGQQIGWGVQFQQPLFLMFISLVLLLFSFNLLDLFEIKVPNLNFFSKSFNNNNFLSDFFYGFFATLMATPCSAPFVGTAVTFAFTQSPSLLVLTFLLMGLGMALPYMVIALIPSMINFIPPPGPWMIWVRRLMSILLLITLVWIITILTNHFNYKFILISILLGFLILFFLVLKRKKMLKDKLILLIIFFIIIIYFLIPSLGHFEKNSELKNNKWTDFNEINIADLIENDKIVFVDITADWCVTCQYNKQKIINTKEIQGLFDKFDVVQIRGDWTLPDKNIEFFLNRYNRFGIPFNIMYSKNLPDGVIFSELLSKKSNKECS